MQDLYVPAATTGKGTASASGELARPAFLDIAKQNRAQTTIEDFLEFCADDAVTMLCAATTYLCEKYPKAYPEPVMLLRKAIKRVSPNKVEPYFRTTAKVVCRRPNLPNISVGTQEGMGGTPSPSPRKARRIKRSVSGRNTSTSLNQLDHAVHHPTLVAKPALRGATPLSYQRTAAKASVTNDLDGWQRDRNIQAWLKERKRKERFRNRMAEERNRNDKEWLDESKERMVKWYGKQGEKIQARAARSFSQTMNQMNQNLAAAKDSPRVKDSPRPSSRASPSPGPRTMTEHLRGDPIVPATI